MNITRNRAWRPIVLLFAAVSLLAACGHAFFGEKHTGKVKEYSYRYHDGVKVEGNIPETVEFSLATFQNRNYFRYNANGLFQEHEAPGILLNPEMSTSAESIYIYDQINKDKFRIVTSLVLNTVSGDISVFHHRSIPPKEWRNSNMYTGDCREKTAPPNNHLLQATDFSGRGYTPREGGVA